MNVVNWKFKIYPLKNTRVFKIGLTSLGTLNPKPGLVTHLDSLFLSPPFLAKKTVGCFWNARSVYLFTSYAFPDEVSGYRIHPKGKFRPIKSKIDRSDQSARVDAKIKENANETLTCTKYYWIDENVILYYTLKVLQIFQNYYRESFE